MLTLERAKEKYPLIPHNTLRDLCEYVNTGCPVGSFLQAVLENNLEYAVRKADPENEAQLTNLVRLIVQDIPMGAWGNPAKVSDWISKRGMEQWKIKT